MRKSLGNSQKRSRVRVSTENVLEVLANVMDGSRRKLLKKRRLGMVAFAQDGCG